MGVNFNLVVTPRPYVGFYRPAHPVFFAASPVFFRPAPLVDPRTALGLTAAAVGIGTLSQAFNNHAHQSVIDHGNRMYLQPQNSRHFTTQQVTPPTQSAAAPPQPAAAKPPEAPKVATPLADALDGAKGLKNGSTDPQAVTALQKFLQKAGYGEMLGKTGADHDGVDGIFKGRTESALEKFQEDNHLPKTGVMDEVTVRKMHEVEQKMTAPKPEESAPQRMAVARSKPSSPGMG